MNYVCPLYFFRPSQLYDHFYVHAQNHGWKTFSSQSNFFLGIWECMGWVPSSTPTSSCWAPKTEIQQPGFVTKSRDFPVDRKSCVCFTLTTWCTLAVEPVMALPNASFSSDITNGTVRQSKILPFLVPSCLSVSFMKKTEKASKIWTAIISMICLVIDMARINKYNFWRKFWFLQTWLASLALPNTVEFLKT